MHKRILVLLSVVALMVVMLAMSVAPAFAAWDVEGGQCRTGSTLVPVDPRIPGLIEADRNGDLKLCSTPRGRDGLRLAFYDNRLD